MPGNGAERARTADELARLAAEVRPYDAAVAVLLDRLADVVRERRDEEARAYASVLDPRAIAELLTHRRSPVWGILEVARNVLVFAPIAVTWYGLSTAAVAYGLLLDREPDLVTRPFLLLWQQGFEGAPGVITFSVLAFIDAALIGLLIVISLLVHVHAELRDVAGRARALLKESQIRGLVGHAMSLAPAEGEAETASAVLDEMVAEERRIYERAMEREQQLFELERAVRELRQAASELARAAEALTPEALPGQRTADEPRRAGGRAARGG